MDVIDDPLEGDRALANLLLFHGRAMNGGLGHAFDGLSDEEYSQAFAGFRFFGMDELVSFLESAASLTEDEQEDLSLEYYVLASDEKIVAKFKAYFQEHPEAFSSLTVNPQ